MRSCPGNSNPIRSSEPFDLSQHEVTPLRLPFGVEKIVGLIDKHQEPTGVVFFPPIPDVLFDGIGPDGSGRMDNFVFGELFCKDLLQVISWSILSGSCFFKIEKQA